jgi:hypothetical protein
MNGNDGFGGSSTSIDKSTTKVPVSVLSRIGAQSGVVPRPY